MTTLPVQSSGGNKIASKSMSLNTEDFINMMVTQLQNQDPLEPVKNEQLLTQMSQIGQLEASNSLQESLKSLVKQSQISSAGSLIGKMVRGLDDQGDPQTGMVSSVRVDGDQVWLELDSGKRLKMQNVTEVATAELTSA